MQKEVRLLPTRTQEQLRKALGDIGYEIDQIDDAYCLLREAQQETAQTNAYLESFLVHIRNLWEFYIPGSNRNSDTVCVRDYCEKFENAGFSYWSRSNKHLRKTLHKRLAHISYSRPGAGSEDRKWLRDEMNKEIASCTVQFIEELLQGSLVDDHDKWESRKDRLKERLVRLDQSTLRSGIKDTHSIP